MERPPIPAQSPSNCLPTVPWIKSCALGPSRPFYRNHAPMVPPHWTVGLASESQLEGNRGRVFPSSGELDTVLNVYYAGIDRTFHREKW